MKCLLSDSINLGAGSNKRMNHAVSLIQCGKWVIFLRAVRRLEPNQVWVVENVI